MYDSYESLEQLTDNTGTKVIQDRYKSFMRVVAQWRYLKRLKRAGRAHDPTGIAGTKQGELAVQCPACPHPDINLPPNWEDVSEDLQYVLHAQFSPTEVLTTLSLDIYTCYAPLWMLASV